MAAQTLFRRSAPHHRLLPLLTVVFFANVLQPLIDFFEAILQFFHDTVGLGWGWAIVALTSLVRAALMPLTLKQFKSMQNMVKFQPEIKQLQERYKGDRERLNQEMMKFYRENKVNPFASCLPLVAQLPVFLALFYMLRTDLRLDICPDDQPARDREPAAVRTRRRREFLFIPDLTDKATGGVLIALIVLYVGSQLLSTILMSTATDRTQRIIFLALPFVFVSSSSASRRACWSTGSRRTSGRSSSRRSCASASARCDHPADGERPPMSIMDRMLHRRGASGAGAARRQSRREPAGRPAASPAASAPQRRTSAESRPPRRHRPRRARRRSDPGGADERAGPDAGRPRPRPARAGQRRAGTRCRGRGRRGGRPHPRGPARRRPRAVHRPPRADDRRGPAPRVQGRRARPVAGAEGGGRRRRLPRAPPPGARAPGRPGCGRRGPLRRARSRWTR